MSKHINLACEIRVQIEKQKRLNNNPLLNMIDLKERRTNTCKPFCFGVNIEISNLFNELVSYVV